MANRKNQSELLVYLGSESIDNDNDNEIKSSPNSKQAKENAQIARDLRSELDPEYDIYPASVERINAFYELLDEEQLQVAVEAKKTCDQWYEAMEDNSHKENQAKATCRVRLRGTCLQIEWSKADFFSLKGKRCRKITHIRKDPKASKYNKSSFRFLPKWAIAEIFGGETDDGDTIGISESIESQNARKRERAKLLNEIRDLIFKYKKLVDSEEYLRGQK